MIKKSLFMIVLIAFSHMSNVEIPAMNILSSNNIEVNVML